MEHRHRRTQSGFPSACQAKHVLKGLVPLTQKFVRYSCWFSVIFIFSKFSHRFFDCQLNLDELLIQTATRILVAKKTFISQTRNLRIQSLAMADSFIRLRLNSQTSSFSASCLAQPGTQGLFWTPCSHARRIMHYAKEANRDITNNNYRDINSEW